MEQSQQSEGKSTERKRPCPMCGELIFVSAIKCRFCGEIFDPTLKRSSGRGRSSEDTELTGVELMFCIICSGIGCIWGLIYLIQGRSSKGGKMIGISILSSIIIRVVFTLIAIAIQANN